MGFKLFYFTESYPFGVGHSWKTNELEILSKKFDLIYVIPRFHGYQRTPLKIEFKNVIILDPCFENVDSTLNLSDLKYLGEIRVLLELFNNKGIISKTRMLKALHFRENAQKILESRSMKFALAHTDKLTVWYFFWARGWADCLPFLPHFERKQIAVRLHGFDLYKERNNGYIPFRKALFNKVNCLLPISEHGKKYLNEEFKVSVGRIFVSRLGTKYHGKAKPSSDSILRILTCSYTVQVKRLDRLISSLKLITSIPIKWTHIGDGPLQAEMVKLSETLPSNVKVEFKGKLSAYNVAKYYADNEIDLFINTSESEGVPVSIMEAFSAGVPVLATDVGGTSEIVDHMVGGLIDSNFSEKILTQEILKFYNLSLESKLRMRNACFERFLEKCDVYKQADKLASILLR